MTKHWLQSFNPNVNELLDLLLPEIDDSMLHQIAEADYGRDVKAHLAPLKRFRDCRIIPTLNWHPVEVLELMRWSQPDAPDWKPGYTGRRGHLIRAFCCCALLRSYERSENKKAWLSFNETAIQLVDSLLALGDEFLFAGISFFAWCIERIGPVDEEGIERPFLGLALLFLATKQSCSRDEAIICLCKWIDQSVSSLLPEHQWAVTRHKNWLLSMNDYNQKNGRWVEVGRNLYQWSETQSPSDMATWVAIIGYALAGD